MKQYFLFLCILCIVTNAECISQFSARALQDITTRGQLQHEKRLTDTQYLKEKKQKRHERYLKKTMQRRRMARERTKKLQSFYNQTDSHRTTADHIEKSRNLCRKKAQRRADHHATTTEKTAYVESQIATAEERINVHIAARNALLRKL